MKFVEVSNFEGVVEEFVRRHNQTSNSFLVRHHSGGFGSEAILWPSYSNIGQGVLGNLRNTLQIRTPGSISRGIINWPDYISRVIVVAAEGSYVGKMENGERRRNLPWELSSLLENVDKEPRFNAWYQAQRVTESGRQAIGCYAASNGELYWRSGVDWVANSELESNVTSFFVTPLMRAYMRRISAANSKREEESNERPELIIVNGVPNASNELVRGFKHPYYEIKAGGVGLNNGIIGGLQAVRAGGNEVDVLFLVPQQTVQRQLRAIAERLEHIEVEDVYLAGVKMSNNRLQQVYKLDD
jgi:hypothetical protein